MKDNNSEARILDCMRQYGEPMSSVEIAEITGINVGTVSGHLSTMDKYGVVDSIRGQRPRLYVLPKLVDRLAAMSEPALAVEEPEPEPEPESDEVLVAEVVVPQIVTVWHEVRDLWEVVTGADVTADDARLMVEIADRVRSHR